MTNINLFALMASRTALVVKTVYINEAGPSKGNGPPTYVEITGRKAGLISWIRSLLGIDTTATFTVHEKRAVFSEKALSGNLTHFFPLASVSNLGAGYLKPFYWLFLAFVTLAGGIVRCIIINQFSPEEAFVTFIVSLCVAALFILFYFLGKTLCLYIVANSGDTTRIFLKRSVIEGVAVDKADAARIVNIILQLVEINLGKTP